jgi:hypothetical protein
MKFLEKSSSQEMVAEWLKAEMWSKRFSLPLKKVLRKFKQSQSIINDPKLDNKRENILRKKVLFTYRKDMLRGFPKNITWQKAIINIHDLEKIKLINYSYWNELSGDTRLAVDAVENILRGKTVMGVNNRQYMEAARHVKKHGFFPKLILISTQPGAPVVVLEGHLRLIAYLMEPDGIPNNLIAIIGYSPEFSDWDLY